MPAYAKYSGIFIQMMQDPDRVTEDKKLTDET